MKEKRPNSEAQEPRPASQPVSREACPGCRAREAEVAYLRQHVRDLTDRMVALASPTALAVARGEIAQPVPQVGLPMDNNAPVVLENGEVTTAGDIRRVQAKIDEAMSLR